MSCVTTIASSGRICTKIFPDVSSTVPSTIDKKVSMGNRLPGGRGTWVVARRSVSLIERISAAVTVITRIDLLMKPYSASPPVRVKMGTSGMEAFDAPWRVMLVNMVLLIRTGSSNVR